MYWYYEVNKNRSLMYNVLLLKLIKTNTGGVRDGIILLVISLGVI